MKVSIITASYNSAAKIQDTINSVAAQDYPNIEYIIIDGGSVDGTLDIIKQNESKISHYLSEKDKGIYDALNKGIRIASGDIIGFLNSDDVYDNNHIVSDIVNTLTQNQADIIFGDITYHSDKEGKRKMIRYWKSNNFNHKSLKYGWMPAHPSLYCTKEVYNSCGFYDDSFMIAADYDFMLRLFNCTNYKKIYLPQVIVNMDTGGISNNSLKNILQKSKEDYRAIRKNNIGGFYTVFFKNFRKIMQFLKPVTK